MHDNSDVLVSVHQHLMPHFLAGRKTVEIRRREIPLQSDSRVWIYCTLPCGAIQAVGLVDRVAVGSPKYIWQKYGELTAIDKDAYEHYLDGASNAVAIIFRKILPLTSAPTLKELRQSNLSFHPPQFYKRLDPRGPELRLLRTRINLKGFSILNSGRDTFGCCDESA